MPVHHSADRCCDFAIIAPAHHHRLLMIEEDPLLALGELIDIASTWGEVEHGVDEPLVEPCDWLRFVELHEWARPEVVRELVLGLWSVTLPRARDVACPTHAGSALAVGTVTQIDAAPSRRASDQTA